MSQESYDYGNKEKALNALTERDFDDSKHLEIYRSEVSAIANFKTYSDLLSLAPWSKVSKLSKIILASLETLDRSGKDMINSDQFHTNVSGKITVWSQEINHDLNRTDTSNKIRAVLQNSRNLLSLIHGHDDLKNVCTTLVLCNNSGLIPQDENTFVLQYPGSFNPFPHVGHVELYTIAEENILNNNEGSFMVVSTFAKNRHRDAQPAFSFPVKIDMLNRGFAFQSKIVVAGLAGDTDYQSKQMLLLSKLGSDKSIHYVLGDDAFVSKVKQAKNKEMGILDLFGENTTFYVSKRNGSDNGAFSASCTYAINMGCKIVFIPNQLLGRSGTEIRQKLESNTLDKNIYPNKYVAESFDRNNYLSLL